MRPAKGPHGRSANGQALAEFALVLPVLMLILAAILQFGLIFSSQIGITNSVREAARYASVQGVTDSSGASSERRSQEPAPGRPVACR